MRIKFSQIATLICITLLVVGLGIVGLYYSFDTYIQLFQLSIGLFFLAIYPIVLLHFLKHKIVVSEHGIEIQYKICRLDKYIPFSSMKSFNEIVRQYKKGEKKCLTILADDKKKYTLEGDEINYSEIKEAILKKQIKEAQYLEEHINSMFYFIFIPTIIFIVALIGTFINYINEPKSSYELITISGTIYEKPKNKTHSRPGSYLGLDIYLREYEDFTFGIDEGDLSKSEAKEIVSKLRFGDTLVLKISKEDYDSKITKTRDAGFFKKHLGWRFINVLELEHKGKIYLRFNN